MTEGPNHFILVLLIGGVTCINREKPPLILLGVMCPYGSHIVYPPLDYRLHSSIQMLLPTGGLVLIPCHPQDALRHEAAPSFSHPNWLDAWRLIQCNKPATRQLTIGGPRGCLFVSHSAKSTAVRHNSLIAAPNIRSQCCRLTEFASPGPAPPEVRPATSVIVSSMISTGESSRGWSGYVSRMAADRGRASWCLVRSTSMILSQVSTHISSGCSTPLSPAP